jgi:mRNA-degrading endonuclease YafQ of YafQ-DinJ toxin-antitoxin module
MLEVEYAPKFVRLFSDLSPSLQVLVVTRIKEFKNPGNHPKLKVHKLKGNKKGFFGFSVDYSHRIIFEYSRDKKTASLLVIGDHSIYD